MNAASEQLSLPAGDEPAHRPATDAVRLLLFNAQHASPERSRRQAAWIAGQEGADIAVLTEVSSTQGGDALVAALTERGYATVIAPQPSSPDYRTVIACRTSAARAVLSPVTVTPHRAPAARVTVGGHDFGVLGLYVPSRGPREQRNVAKRAFQEAVTESLPRLLAAFPGTPVIVAGDLNVIERGHQPPHKVFGEWEYVFYDSFQAAGLTDAFRHVHPDQVVHSWFGRSGNGFRFDHIFISADHAERVLACAYHLEACEMGLTDHAVMTLLLGLPPTPGEPSSARSTRAR
ncbi:endonuclease/exonuclease/phosphatase family protein [Streptomyces californicus]|uniref:endonuclease/exonuclease/phosphatase family protein n=1 Tax=Streptomyces californicus TaxID=67351 RepID=UPI00296FC65D|nr:endonuclease/exonuclease/phosphatase family protein [Streptomyces californicus]MDW4916260.1 endonuclease [Streptomyces californicus]